jgi:dihydroorotase-like cyclic amidohydrolase
METRPIETKKEEVKKEQKKTEQSAADFYWNWVKASPMLTANDVAVFGQDDGVIVVFTDKLGRSISAASFFLPAEVAKKITNMLSTK